jgi:flagellar hook-associated protein 1 FlgK
MPNIIYGTFNVAKTALMTQQKALAVTANNIANVNTEGYSRQRLNMEQNEPVRSEGGSLGTGVRANRTIQRSYDRFLAAQIADATSQEGRWQAQRETLEKAELMFDDAAGYGLNGAMSEFWNAWQAVANTPSGYAERATLLASSENLTQVFNQLSRDLTQVQVDSDVSITGAVADINALTGEIADLNLKIMDVEAGNRHSANAFRDQRDLTLKTLSSLVDVSSFEDADGFLTVVSAGGHTLVDRTRSWSLRTETNADGLQDVYWESTSGSRHNMTDDISTGKLKGWIEARDTRIPAYLTQLDDMAVSLADAVNAQHAGGLDLYGAAGVAFFTPVTGADDITVNTVVSNDPNRVAAAANTENIPGGNGNAVAMAEIQGRLLMSGGSATMDDFYSSLVSDAGRYVSQATVNNDHQSAVALQLNTYREEVSGVSMDEEMVNMVQFQNAYNAAAKLVTTVDEMLESLIAMV